LKIDILTHLSMSYFGGGEREMVDLGLAMRRRGHDVTIRSLPYTLNGVKRVRPEDVLEGLPYSESWIHRSRADIAYSFYHPFSAVNFQASGKRIASFHSLVWFTKHRVRYTFVPKVAASLSRFTIPLELPRYNAVQVHEDSVGDQLKRYNANTWVIGHPVDVEVFRPTVTKDDRFTILFAGRPLWQKGWDRFEGLAQRLGNNGIRFAFVGGFSRNQSIESYGFVQDRLRLADIYSKVHLLVMPSRVDTVGRSELEAMACGTPVITTSTSRSIESSALIRASPEELEGRSIELYKSWREGNGYEDLIRAARRDCARAFSFEAVMDRYEEMFQRVLEGPDV